MKYLKQFHYNYCQKFIKQLRLFKIIQKMQIVNQIGHVQFWGMSPAANILKHYAQQSEEPLRILMSGCSDIRHILKTLTDINQQQIETKKNKFRKIEIYFHETNKELLARCLLFMHILHETELNFDERIQIFLDLYGNAMIKERNARYLHNLREDLLNFIHEEKIVVTPLKSFVRLNLLRFDERDEISDIIQSWSTKVSFDMEKMRDQKLRYLFRERYDYRANLIDWDFNMLLAENAPIIHYYHYKEWRLSGLAYEQRFSKYCEPNRTLSSYAPGRKKEDKTSCLVRGYWGDIVMSPYISIGIKCDYKQSDLLFKKANLKFIGHSVELAQYNMVYWLTMLQKNEEYVRVFRDYYRADEETKKKLEQKNQGKKKEKSLNTIKEEEQQIKENDNQSKGQQLPNQKGIKNKSKDQQVLDSDEEQQKKRVEILNSKEIVVVKQQREVLKGFKNYDLVVYQMGMNSQKLISKKYVGYFDVAVLGFIHSAYLNKGVHGLIKKGGQLYCEKATYLVPKKKQQRSQLNLKMKELIQKNGCFKTVTEDSDFFIYQKI